MKKLLLVLVVLTTNINYINAQCTYVASYASSIDPANNGQVTFTNTSSSDSLAYFHWDFGDGTSDNSPNPPLHTYNGTGSYYACLTVSDSLGMYDSLLGCHNVYCTSISVINNFATCNAHFVINYDSTGIYFANTSTGVITNYYWDYGDGTTSTSAYPPSHIYSSGGFYNVCLTTTNPSTLCNSSFCDSVYISTCAASYSYIHDSTGNGITFNGGSTGPGSAYSWDFGDGSTSLLQNPYHIFTSNGSYYVCMSVSSPSDSACHSSTCQLITLSGICDADFTIVKDSFSITTYYIYSYANGSGAVNYLWDFGDSTTSTLAYPSHTYATSGPFQICLTVNDGIGCSDIHCDSIGTGHSMSTPITLTVLATGVHEQTNPILSLENYPNPFNTTTTILYSIQQDAKVELAVFDLLGNKIASLENSNKQIGSYTMKWNSEEVAQGMYLLQLKAGSSSFTKKLIINK